MAIDNKLSTKIQSQLPSYLIEDGPKLVSFMKAYYEWLETTGQVNDRAQNLLKFNDVDDTLQEFIDYFNREILSKFPKDVLADRKMLMKNVRDMYRTKGSEQAYRLLFRLLYNEEIQFYYPGQDVLRTSDGRWVQDTIIRLSGPFTGDVTNLGGQTIRGLESNATAQVLRVVSTTETGVPVFTVYVENVNGEFLDNESVRNTSNTVTAKVLSTIGSLQSVNITFGGSNSQLGDSLTFTSSSGASGLAIVSGTTDSSLEFTIVDGGSGYASNANIVIQTLNTGSGADFSITGIGNTESISLNTDIISDEANTLLSGTFLNSANISSTLSSAFTFSNTQYGSITSISQTPGSNYTVLPEITVTQPEIAELKIDDGQGGIKGQNAVIEASFKPGAITSVTVLSSTGSFLRGDTLTFTNTTRNGDNAQGLPVISGIVKQPGAYRDTKGFLSWNNKLQDSNYYQQYSYVIQSSQNISAYRKFVNELLHPTGHKLFGETEIQNTLDASSISTQSSSIKYIEVSTQTVFVPEIVSGDVTTYTTDEEQGAVDIVPEIDTSRDIDFTVVDVPTVEVGSGFNIEYELEATQTQSSVVTVLEKKNTIESVTIQLTGPLESVVNLRIGDINGQQISQQANVVIGTGELELPRFGTPQLTTS